MVERSEPLRRAAILMGEDNEDWREVVRATVAAAKTGDATGRGEAG